MKDTQKEFINLIGYIKGRKKLSISEITRRFQLENNQLLELFSYLSSKSIVEAKISKDLIEIQRIEKLDQPKKIWLKNEIYILGYCTLYNIVSTKDIAKNLEIDQDVVDTVIFSNNAWGRIEASFGIKSKKNVPEKLYVKILQYPQLRLRNQIQFNSIPQNEWINYSSAENAIDDNITGIMDNVSLLQVVKTIAGILLLRGEVAFSSLVKQILFPIEYFDPSSKNTILMRLLSLLAISNLMEIIIDEGQIYCKRNTSNIQSIDKIIHPSGFEEFDYETLLGLLSTRHSIKLSDITNQMATTSWKWENTEILCILAHLAIDGIIRGTLDPDDTLIGIEVQNLEESDSALSRSERILLGMLKGRTRVKIKDLAKILDLPDNEAQQVFYTFINQGKLTGEISRGGDIIIHSLPTIPPLTQILNLPVIDRELLGYLIARKELSYRDYQEIWNISNLDIDEILYNLVGSGVVKLAQKKDKFTFFEITSSQPPPALDKKKNRELYDLSEYLENNDPPIDIDLLRSNTNLEYSVLMKNISFLVGSGYYLNAKLNKNTFDKGGIIRIFSIKFECYNCGALISKQIEICPECNSAIKNCSVCKGYIKVTSPIFQCQECDYPSHVNHLRSWLKIKNECPICRNGFSPDEINKINNLEVWT